MFGRKKINAGPPVAEAADPASPVAPVSSLSPPRRSLELRGGIESENRKLVVGRDIVLQGEISSCEHLFVEGLVEADLSDCRELEVARSGILKGKADIEVADIGGVFEGTLTARKMLVVRATGRVSGTVRYVRIEVERGGEIVGDVRAQEPAPPVFASEFRISAGAGAQ